MAKLGINLETESDRTLVAVVGMLVGALMVMVAGFTTVQVFGPESAVERVLETELKDEPQSVGE